MAALWSKWPVVHISLAAMAIHSVTCWIPTAARTDSPQLECSDCRRHFQLSRIKVSSRPPSAQPAITRLWMPTRASESLLTLRGGFESGSIGGGADSTELQREGSNDFQSHPSGKHDTRAVDKIEKIAADLRAKRDDIAADVRARSEAFKADLKAKHEKITDEVLRDRSPEVVGELCGHRSYDSTTAVST